MRHQSPKNRRTRTRKSSPRTSGVKLDVRVPRDYPWYVLDRLVTDLAQHLPAEDLSTIRSVVRSRSVDEYLQLSNVWGLQSIASHRDVPLWVERVRLMLGSVLKKFPFEGDAEERRKVALEKFSKCEEDCSAFNVRGYKRLFDESGTPIRPLLLAQHFIARVLDVLDEDKVQIWSRHGPGSSTSTRGPKCTVYYKYAQWPYHVTPRAVSSAQRLIRSDPRWVGALEDSYRERFGIKPYELLDWAHFWDSVFTEVDGNRITTVPKDSRKDRPIAIEPTMNLALQLGVDGYIRRRLRRWGINLNSQFRNQELAREGSVRKDYFSPVTIDLSNASDTVSLRAARLLLPRDWFEYVCAIRSPRGSLPCGREQRYSKLSSMGNGATFAIESLIFTALCYAASVEVLGEFRRDDIVVYGDDIVVPQVLAFHVLNYLELFGFSPNMEKSFLDGPVRESCGSDWFNGRMVRPVHLGRMPEDVPCLYAHRNLVNRWAERMLGVSCPKVDALYRNWIPDHLWCEGPYSDEEFSAYWHSKTKPGYTRWSYEFQSLAAIPRRYAGRAFFFRKLMAPLRQGKPVEIPNYLNDVTRLRTVSSTFVVTQRDALRYGVITRRTPTWRDEYSPCDTPDAGNVAGAGRGH